MAPIRIDLAECPATRNDYTTFLAWLASLFPRSARFVECGTHSGRGANALAFHGNRVDTYDLDPTTRGPLLPNVCAQVLDAFDIPDDTLTGAALIYLDIDPHTGTEERRFYEKLKTLGFSGLLVCDDIYLDADFKPRHLDAYKDSQMPAFWKSIEHPKLDTGLRAHDSGMGVVSFSPDIQLIG